MEKESKIEKIKLGDPQPVPCEKCGKKMGYQVSDNIRLNYDTIYSEKGQHESGLYSDYAKTLHYGKTAYCPNCGSKLKFKIDR